MMPLIEFGCRAYDLTLRFYPRSLQRQFGTEMSEVFREQAREAWEQGGWTQLMPVWGCAARELFVEVFLARAMSPACVTGAASCLCTAAAFLCLLWSFDNPLAVKALGDRMHQVLWDHGTAARSASPHRIFPSHRVPG